LAKTSHHSHPAKAPEPLSVIQSIAKASEAPKARWADPALREKMIEGMAGRTRRKLAQDKK
jgi:hypothetical protein